MSFPAKSTVLLLMCLSTFSCGDKGTQPLNKGSLSVSSEPAGAAIWLDETPTGQVTPWTFTDLPAAKHLIKLQAPYFTDWQDTIIVSPDQNTPVHAILSLATGSLIVESSPEGANIWFDEHLLDAVTPDTLTGIIGGIHSIGLTLSDHPDWRGYVRVITGITNKIRVTLE